MMKRSKALEDVQDDLAALLADCSPVEKALLIGRALHEVFGGEWVVEANADNQFVVRRPDG